MNATGSSQAGIGARDSYSNAAITINGGIINAKGGYGAAGIGGAYGSSGKNITINGGKIVAIGGQDASGIGGGKDAKSNNIKVSTNLGVKAGASAESAKFVENTGADLAGALNGKQYAEVKARIKLATPEKFKVDSTTDASISVSWNAVDNASGYQVEYRVKGSKNEWTVLAPTKETTLKIEGLTRNTTYRVRVKAVGSGVYFDSEYKGMDATTAKTALTSVSIGGAAKVGETLTATVAPNGASVTYAWYRSGVSESIATGATYTLTTADVGAVLTVKTTGSGDYTGEVSASTSDVPKVELAKPQNFKVVATTDSSITVSWNAVENASGYRVEYRVKGSQNEWTVLDTNDTTLKIEGLSRNTGYRVRVKAVGVGAYSDSDYNGKDATTAKTALTSVSISGTVSVGETLTATVAPNDATITYVWYRSSVSESFGADHRRQRGRRSLSRSSNASEIVGTGATYKVTTADVGAVLTVKATGSGDYTCEVSASTQEVPTIKLATPENFQVIATTDASISVSWNAVENASGYKVEYRVKGSQSDWTVLDTNAATLKIEGLSRNTNYRIRVKAVGSGAYSDSDYAKLDATTEKTALTSVSISGTLAVDQTLTATVDTSGATAGYAWYRSGVSESIASGATYTVTTADVGAVLTVKATGTGDYVGEVSASTQTVPAVKLATSQNFKIVATTDASITVSWNEVENADRYQVEYRVKGSKSDWSVLDTNETTLKIDSLTRNTNYRIRVKAVGSGAYSDSDYAGLDATTEKTALVSVSISGTATVGKTLTATSLLPKGATANYVWSRSGDDAPIAEGASYKITSADVGRKLTVKAVGSGDYTGVVSATSAEVSRAKLATPKNFRVVSKTDSTIKVAWKADANAESCQVEYRTVSGEWTVAKTTENSFVVDGLTRNTQYEFRVKALGSAGYSDSGYATLTATTAKTKLTSVSISGKAEVGQTLTATSLSPEGATASYAWYRSGESDPIGEGATYKVSAEDVGHTLRVKATGTGDYRGAVVSAGTTKVPKARLATPENFRVVARTDTTITVAWNVVANADGYALEHRKIDEETWLTVDFGDAVDTGQLVFGLTPATEYVFRVKALGSGAYVDSDYDWLTATTDAAAASVTETADEDVIPTGNVMTNAWSLSGFVGVVASVASVEVAEIKKPTFTKAGKIAESSDVRSEIFATLGEDEFDALDLDVAFDALV